MAEQKTVLKVSQAVHMANGVLSSIPQLRVVGEVSGFRGRNARSGHCYFSIKDDSASMDCIIWRSLYDKSGIELRDGLMIELTGSFNIYEASGKMSFVATRVAVAGEGMLRQQIAELAAKLQAEGLLADSRKRPIPRFCERVAVCTSLSGSVIDDVKRTLKIRNPLVQISVVGCAVQGAHAPKTIVRALQVAATADVECILLVRGGGSLEDLMAFNDESVARAIAASPIPVVTGIGHEPDTSIADMVADRRCSTPTSAATSVAPTFDEIVMAIKDRQSRLASALDSEIHGQSQVLDRSSSDMRKAVQTQIASLRQRIDSLSERRCMQDPTWVFTERKAAIELTSERLHEAVPRLMQGFTANLGSLSERLSGSLPRQLKHTRAQVESAQKQLTAAGMGLVKPYALRLERDAAALSALSPLNVLQRGYAIVRDAEGHVASDVNALKVGSEISVTLGNGTVNAEVTNIHTDKN